MATKSPWFEDRGGAASVAMVFFDEEEAIIIIYILLTFVSLSSNGDQGQTKDGKYAGNRRKHLRCLYLATISTR